MAGTKQAQHEAGWRRPLWKKFVRGSLVFFAVCLLGVGTAGYFVVHSQAFHRYVLLKMEKMMDAATGGRTTIENFAVQWPTLTIDFYGLTLRGTEPPGSPALLSTPHVQAELTLRSFWRRDINLDAVVIDHLVVHILVDPGGNTNIPRLATALWQSNNNAPSGMIGLALKHFSLKAR